MYKNKQNGERTKQRDMVLTSKEDMITKNKQRGKGVETYMINLIFIGKSCSCIFAFKSCQSDSADYDNIIDLSFQKYP
jgi:hypothetical protein